LDSGWLRQIFYDRKELFFIYIYQHSSSILIWLEYLSQLIRYSRASGSNQDFFDIGLLLTRKFMGVPVSSRKFEDTKGTIRSHQSKSYRQYNDQPNRKNKNTNNYPVFTGVSSAWLLNIR
jgi:hypothetical protein